MEGFREPVARVSEVIDWFFLRLIPHEYDFINCQYAIKRYHHLA